MTGPALLPYEVDVQADLAPVEEAVGITRAEALVLLDALGEPHARRAIAPSLSHSTRNEALRSITRKLFDRLGDALDRSDD